jgi:peptidoglycan hydrolase CwlO-like protein
MNSKFYIITIACLVGGLAGGYLIANNMFQNQLAVYDLRIQSVESAMNASTAQIQALQAEIQTRDAQI